MSSKPKLNRRGFLTRGLAVASAALLGGCDGELSEQPWVKRILSSAETLTRVTQRALIPANALAREYSEAEISKDFKANGSTDVDDDDYTVWEATFDMAGVGLAADGNGNGVVDAADYTVWRDNFGASVHAGAGSGATVVPEPTAVAIIAVSLFILPALTCRRRLPIDLASL